MTKRASGLLSISGLLNSLLPESQKLTYFEELDNLIKNYNTENWIINYTLGNNVN